MPDRNNFFDDFHNEILSEMAGNFFGHRKEMEGRLEAFAGLVTEVKKTGERALRQWKRFFTLFGDTSLALDFLRQEGVEADHLPPLAEAMSTPRRLRLPFAFTAAGRFRKSVRLAYQTMRQVSLEYMEGGYVPAPGNPARKALSPNRDSLQKLSAALNQQVAAVNASQTASMVLGFARSLDAASVQKGNIAGATLEDPGALDKDLAFTPIDFDSLGLPVIPVPPPLPQIQGRLDEASSRALGLRRAEALAAMRLLFAK